MESEIWSIIDTAVKIGLGALISGFATYRVTKLNHDNSLEKARSDRQRELLEEISSQVELFSNSVLKYWAYMIEHVRYKHSEKDAPDDLKPRIDQAAIDLFDRYTELASAEGKLILIGAEEAQSLVRDYGEYIKEFRKASWQGNHSLTESDLDKSRIEILEKRKKLYQSLRSAYAN